MPRPKPKTPPSPALQAVVTKAQQVQALSDVLVAVRRTNRWYSLYAILAVGVWAAMLASGVHATVAGEREFIK